MIELLFTNFRALLKEYILWTILLGKAERGTYVVNIFHERNCYIPETYSISHLKLC